MSSYVAGVELCTRCQTVHWVHVRPSPSVSVRSVRPFVRPSVRPLVGSSILIAIYITIFACIYHENDNDISAIYALRRDPQGVGGAGHDWERPTLLNPPASLSTGTTPAPQPATPPAPPSPPGTADWPPTSATPSASTPAPPHSPPPPPCPLAASAPASPAHTQGAYPGKLGCADGSEWCAVPPVPVTGDT